MQNFVAHGFVMGLFTAMVLADVIKTTGGVSPPDIWTTLLILFAGIFGALFWWWSPLPNSNYGTNRCQCWGFRCPKEGSK